MRFIVLILALILVGCVTSQTPFHLKGKLVDENGKPLKGVEVKLQGLTYADGEVKKPKFSEENKELVTVKTDTNGAFEADLVSEHEYDLAPVHSGSPPPRFYLLVNHKCRRLYSLSPARNKGRQYLLDEENQDFYFLPADYAVDLDVKAEGYPSKVDVSLSLEHSESQCGIVPAGLTKFGTFSQPTREVLFFTAASLYEGSFEQKNLTYGFNGNIFTKWDQGIAVWASREEIELGNEEIDVSHIMIGWTKRWGKKEKRSFFSDIGLTTTSFYGRIDDGRSYGLGGHIGIDYLVAKKLKLGYHAFSFILDGAIQIEGAEVSGVEMPDTRFAYILGFKTGY